MTCQEVAKHLGLSWDTVRDIEKRRLKRDFEKPPLKDVTHIAIDEIAIRKGHNYLTIVVKKANHKEHKERESMGTFLVGGSIMPCFSRFPPTRE